MEALAQQWISLWCAPVDWALFEALHADDFEDCAAAGRPPTRQGFGEGLAAMATAFPDLQTVVDDLVIDTEQLRIAVRWTATGTNRQAFLDAGPTHRLTRITGIEIIELRAGRIARRWGEWDISDHLRAPPRHSNGNPDH